MEKKAKKELKAKHSKGGSDGTEHRKTEDGQDKKGSLGKGKDSKHGSSVQEPDLQQQDMNPLSSDDEDRNEAPQISRFGPRPTGNELRSLKNVDKRKQADKKGITKSTKKRKSVNLDVGPSLSKKHRKCQDSGQTDTKLGKLTKQSKSVVDSTVDSLKQVKSGEDIQEQEPDILSASKKSKGTIKKSVCQGNVAETEKTHTVLSETDKKVYGIPASVKRKTATPSTSSTSTGKARVSFNKEETESQSSESDEEGELEPTFSCMEQPPLIKQLKAILSEYPDNGQIIKELLQNAEDARASDVEIIYDKRTINQKFDRKKEFRKFFKGPALCVKNNSLFSENDWKGIKMVASSVKEKDRLKVGRFGLGFKSVFHMTDHPCIMSGDRILLVDPTRPSDQVNIEMKLKNLKRIRGMDVEAFNKAFGQEDGLDNRKFYYFGTLFWFPLRDSASPISSTLYDEEKILDLFLSFQNDCSEILVFLRHVECVSLYTKSRAGEIKREAGAEIIENKLSVREKRNEFVSAVTQASFPDNEPVTCSFSMQIRTTNSNGSITNIKWIVVHYFMGNNSSPQLQTLVQNPDHSFNPLVGVAFPVTKSSLDEFEGHIFCFLPLPREGSRPTGLPVHVNGFFSLSQNRHHMKSATNDQKGQKVKDPDILWNQSVIEECLPEAYKKLLEILIEEAVQAGNTKEYVDFIYRSVPDESGVLDRWKAIPRQICDFLKRLPFLYSQSQRRYIVMDEAVFATLRSLPTTVEREAIVTVLSKLKVMYVSTGLETFEKVEYYSGGTLNDLSPKTFASMLNQETYVLNDISRSQRYSILSYLLLDNQHDYLQGLPLLEVASRDWLSYGREKPVYLCDDEKVAELVPEFEKSLIYQTKDHGDFVWQHLKNMAEKEAYQLKILTISSLMELLHKALGHRVGSFTINNQSQLEWLERVWKFASTKSLTVDQLGQICLVPQRKSGNWESVGVIKLHPVSHLFLKKYDVPEEVCECFTKLGVIVLPDMPPWFSEKCIGSNLHSSRPNQLSMLLAKIWKLSGRTVRDSFNRDISMEKRDKFVKYIKRVNYLDSSGQSLLCSLKIFSTEEMPKDINSYTSVEEITEFIRGTDIPVGLNKSFIRASSDSLQLLEKLNVREVTKLSLIDMILTDLKHGSSYDEEECERFMVYFVKNIKEFETSQKLMKLAAQISFLKSDSGNKRPKDLFNPDNSLLQNLFTGQKDKFPIAKNMMCNTSALIQLGLKERNMIVAEDIAEAAYCIHSWISESEKYDMCVKKSEAVLTFLNSNPPILQQFYKSNTLLHYLKHLKFVACSQKKPKHFPGSLSWHNKQFCAPQEARVRTYDNECLVGAVMPLMDQTFNCLLSLFPWNAKPPCEKVTNQLVSIKQCYTLHEKSHVLPLLDKIYEFMMQNGTDVDVNEIEKEGLIWIGDTFEQPTNVIIRLRSDDIQDLRPYFFNVTPEFEKYENFFERVGCFSEQTVSVLIRALTKIKEKYQSKQEIDGFEHDRDIVSKIIDKLAERRNEVGNADILLPIQTGNPSHLTFQPAHRCTFDKNASRYKHEEGDNTIMFVSDFISLDAARVLGAKPLSKQILLGTESMGIEGFGQNEKLTDRIRKLISESYTDGLSVPKELIQNADDAGATVVKILFDEREHQDARDLLLSKEMAGCQGPSIVVYNDAVFSDMDFVNITKLNGATKELDENKIGRFGLGFCAVYNLTDVPSFVSRSNIVIFDPQKSFLGDAVEDGSPGIKIDFRKPENKKLLRLHQDQFKPFQELFGCDMNELPNTGFNGTMFRLPLRTSEQADCSTISKVSYSRDEVKELFAMFIKNAGNMLLFTQNVRQLELYHIPKGAKSIKDQEPIFSVSKNKHSKQYPLDEKQGNTILKRATVTLSANQHFQEVEKFRLNVHTKVTGSFLIPSVKEDHNSETAWFVVWETGLKESLQMSKTIQEQRAIPLSAIAVPVDSAFSTPLQILDSSKSLYQSGHMFCFLPLPIKTNLSFHINGSFDVTSDRRRLVTLSDDDKISRTGKWNEFLLSDASVNAFLSVLKHFKEYFPNNSYRFHDLWPTDSLSITKSFCQSFFKRLVDEQKPLFYGQGTWAPFSEIVFLDHKIRKHPDIGEIAFRMISSIGESRGKILVDLPEPVTKCLEAIHNISNSFIGQTEFLELFLEKVLHDYWTKHCDERVILITYALKSKNAAILNKMKDCKCIPVQPNGTLKKPCEVVSPNGQVSCLFVAEDEVFPHQDLQVRDTLEPLTQLGMIDDKLPADMLVNRFATIEQIATDKCTRCALDRCKSLLRYITDDGESLCMEKNTEERKKISDMFILPVLKRPQQWPFSWNADHDSEVKVICNNLHCEQHLNDGSHQLLLGKPTSLYIQSLYDLGGTVINVVDENLLKHSVTSHNFELAFNFLDLNLTLPTFLAVQHVINLSIEYLQSEEQYQKLHKILGQLYDLLKTRVGEADGLEKVEVEHELGLLKDKPVILIGKSLCLPHKVAFSIEQECPPHLIKLPLNYAFSYKELFEALGVKKAFTVDDIVEVLIDMRSFWTGKECEDIDTVRKLLQNLQNYDRDMLSRHEEDIVAPDIHGYLYPMHELVIADEEFETKEYMHVIHRSIAPSLAEHLGCKRKQRKCFDHISTRIGIPFGQREKLVTRLKSLLKSYPCDSSIMKELLQNADDADASEICFIKDYRTHTYKGIFDPSCESLQGPSLCVFNDSYFTEKDLQGIHDLGQGSKQKDLAKTGQYGVGFNSVYHLTDTPSFVSKGPGLSEEGLLIIFDPLCSHIPGVQQNEPGVKSEVKDLQRDFPGVLAGFEISKSLFKENNGTLFRFPLRKLQSELSSTTHSEQSVNSMLKDMSGDIFESLLFVKSVGCIRILNVTSGKVVEEYSVQTEISKEDREKRSCFFDYVRKICKDQKCDKSKLLFVECKEICYKMKIIDSKGRQETYRIVQRFGFNNPADDVPADVLYYFRDEHLGCLPFGGVAHRICGEFEGDGSKVFCFLPLPGSTPLPVHVNGHFALDDARRDFIKDGYRKTWNELLLRKVVVPAYIQCLFYWRKAMSDEIRGLKKWDSLTKAIEKYHSSFPLLSQVFNPYWKFLITEFYTSVIASKYALFPVVKAEKESSKEVSIRSTHGDDKKFVFACEWVPLAMEEECFYGHFNTIRFTSDFNHRTKQERSLESLLKNLGMKIIQTPQSVRKVISECGIGNPACTNPDDVVKFIATYANKDGPCQIGQLGATLESTNFRVLQNLKLLLPFMQQSTLFIQKLECLPILLTNGNHLKVFSKDHPVFCSEYCWMFPADNDKFIHNKLIRIYPFERLIKEGYIKSFSLSSFVDLIPEKLKQVLCSGEATILLKLNSDSFPSIKWIAWFWKFLSECESRNSFEENVREFSEWALLPAIASNQESSLVQISKSFLLFDIDSFTENETLKAAVSMFEPYLLNRKIIEKVDLGYGKSKNGETASNIIFNLKKLITTVWEPGRLLEFLVFKTRHGFSRYIETDKAMCLLKYFTQSLDRREFKEIWMVKKKLQSLPLYVTLRNNCISLDSVRQVFVIPPGMPVVGLDILESQMSVALLKEMRALHDLYTFLNLSDINVVKLYSDLLLPNISILPRRVWLKHIRYIRDHQRVTMYSRESDDTLAALYNHLQNLDFIETDSGYKKCSDFYNHNHDIFKVMCTKDEFVPKKFRGSKWIPFLKALGLHNSVTDNILIEFARRVESLDKSDKSLQQKSEKIRTHFIQNIDKWEKQTLHTLATICFIWPVELKLMYQKLFALKDGGKLICTKDAVESIHLELCWSTVSVLPFSVPEGYHQDLGIHIQPPLVEVLKHCQNVSTEMREKLPECHENDIKTLMNTWYSFLEKHSNNTLAKDMLQPFPIIHLPSEEKMVKIDDIVLEISSAHIIKPYLFKAPVEYGPYFKLFLSLGTSDEVKCYHYQNVLRQIASQARQKEITPPELRIVKLALFCLYQSLQNCSGDEFTNQPLFLPNSERLMYKSTELVIIDDKSLKERMEEMKEINCFIGFRELELEVDPNIFVTKLPERLLPKLLSRIVSKKFDIENMVVVENSKAALQLTSFIRSDEFVRGLCRILKKECYYTRQTFDPVGEVQRIKESILQISFIEVVELKTYLLYQNKIVDGSHRSRDFLFEEIGKENSMSVNFYFKVSDQNLGKTLNDLLFREKGLSHVILKYTRIPFGAIMTVGSMLRLIDNPEGIASLLDKDDYPMLDANIGLHSFSVFPSPGTYVEEKFHPFLEQALGYFDESEFLSVAMELEDEEMDVDREGKSEVSPVYIYVHIMKETTQELENRSLINIKYLVDVGEDDNVEIPGYCLYRFVRRQDQTSDLTAYTGKSPQQFLPFDENCTRIKNMLQDGWTLPDKDRRRIIRRLLFQWHPDKNQGSEEYASKVFNFIKQLILKLEDCGSLSDEDDVDGRSSDFSSSTFNCMYNSINRRARSYARAYRDNLADYNRSYRTGNFSHKHAASAEAKDPTEARRWMQQSKRDFVAVTTFIQEAENPKAYNWICYMCHQASEKAIKAACYSKNANVVSLKTHDLEQPASSLSTGLAGLARQMESHLGKHTRMRYPENRASNANIPSDMFTKSHAEKAIEIAKQIIEASNDFLV